MVIGHNALSLIHLGSLSMVCYGGSRFLLTAALFISLQPINFCFIARQRCFLSHLPNGPDSHFTPSPVLLFYATISSAFFSFVQLFYMNAIVSTFIANSDLCHYTLIPVVEISVSVCVCGRE